MRVSAFAAICATLELAAASTCRVYISDPESRPNPRTDGQILSPLAARLVLAHRAGVEEFHKNDLTRQEAIAGINNFGKWTPLLQDVPRGGDTFVLLDDDSDLSADVKALPYFDISPSPEPAALQDLLKDLTAQFASFESEGGWETTQHTEDAMSVVTGDAKIANAALSEKKTGRGATIIVTSPSTVDELEGNTDASWGSYAMPNQDSQLRKRKAAQSEVPLELEPEPSTHSSVKSSKGDFSSAAGKSNNQTVRGILPACFSSQSACETTTHNCSGHGKCYRKYTDPDAADTAPNKHCYTCQCVPTVEKNKDGQTTKTTWGGPACSKKDVSIQFWLIALFTVGLVSLVSFAVGTIWSMGNEELPSVIGAGVSGPVKR